MLELYKLGPDSYWVHSNGSWIDFEGTQLEVLVYCTSALKMQPDELQAALLDMIKKDHDSANFGINRTFIYSFNRDEKYGRKVS
jgi:hypothetical protein